MKLLAMFALIGAMALASTGLANAQTPTCKVDPSHPRSPDCPTYPTDLPTLEISVEMQYPVCVIKTNLEDFPTQASNGDIFYGLRVGSRHPFSTIGLLLHKGFFHSQYATKEEFRHRLSIHAKHLRQLLGDIESEYGAHVSFQWSAPNQYSDDKWIHNGDNWIRLQANMSQHEFETRANDCAERLVHEKYNRIDRKQSLEEFTDKQVALEQAQWALSEEIRLQQDLLKLTQSAIAAQNKADDAWRQLAEVRMAGLEARTALWQAYADGAAEESAQFFQQMQDRQDALNAAIAETESNLAKRDAVRQDIEALISDYEAKLAELDAKVAAAQAEAAQVNSEIEALRNAN